MSTKTAAGFEAGFDFGLFGVTQDEVIRLKLPIRFRENLDNNRVTQEMANKFLEAGLPLSPQADVEIVVQSSNWRVVDRNPTALRPTYDLEVMEDRTEPPSEEGEFETVIAVFRLADQGRNGSNGASQQPASPGSCSGWGGNVDGGEGMPGGPGTPGVAGAVGDNGLRGQPADITINEQIGDLVVMSQGGNGSRGGRGGTGGSGGRGGAGGDVITGCDARTGDGGKGGNAGVGGNGGRGGDGADAMDVYIITDRPERVIGIPLASSPARGGDPGVSGIPGLGGPSGSGGTGGIPGSSGEPAENGERGPDGDRGGVQGLIRINGQLV